MKKKNYENYKKLNKTMNMKMLIAFILGAVISITSSYAIAETLIKSADVSYVDNAKLGATNVQAAIDGTCTKFSNDLATILDKMYPIGSIYISTTLSTPAQVGSAIGGTWETYGKGQTLVGVDTSQTEFNTVSKTGGAKSVSTTLKEANLPAHTHDISHTHTTSSKVVSGSTESGITSTEGWLYYAGDGDTQDSVISTYDIVSGSSNITYRKYAAGESNVAGMGLNHNHKFSVTVPSLSTDSISTTKSSSTGNGTAFSTSTLQPYITVYMYRRTK